MSSALGTSDEIATNCAGGWMVDYDASRFSSYLPQWRCWPWVM